MGIRISNLISELIIDTKLKENTNFYYVHVILGFQENLLDIIKCKPSEREMQPCLKEGCTATDYFYLMMNLKHILRSLHGLLDVLFLVCRAATMIKNR